jgi:2,4-dienoyl-CoA reductase (NADPH2)
VHAEAGGKIALQILHTGRYGYHPLAVAPSRLKSPDLALHARLRPERAGWSGRSAPSCNCAAKAREAGYDGVEVMGSEGYFINQFLSLATNQRSDAWGGDYSRTACACRWRSCAHACARRWGRTSSSSTACR